ncbi:coiled-coil domain-containing protein 34 isoform X2 [Dunckerocampus dactyliophorus]|uniref:coiled-coil domain-containing protein 34 isoform X2 n=1 Tax=Dunckerocampus dactyliophorus TaxID=161453 RepID=UPI002404AAB0|nr:coiled-coil domain-containing protein 34 isoform X2 [Dunckerocampus dactyliophorus]
MSGWWLPSSPAFASEDFSSTPLKANERKHVHVAKDLGANDVLPEDDDTFSLLSPIYHDSYESDDDDELSTTNQTSPKYTHEHSISSVRHDLWKASTENTGPEVLSAWEVWLVNKIKEDKLRLKKKTEELSQKEKKEQQEAEREQKRSVEEKKIRDWQQMKREQERREQLLKSSREEAEMRQKQEKQRETEQKAQQKYEAWLQKKNHEKVEKAKKEKVKPACFLLFLQGRYCLTMCSILCDRRRQVCVRSRRRSDGGGQRRTLRNGWQNTMKNAEQLPKPLIIQQVLGDTTHHPAFTTQSHGSLFTPPHQKHRLKAHLEGSLKNTKEDIKAMVQQVNLET